MAIEGIASVTPLANPGSNTALSAKGALQFLTARTETGAPLGSTDNGLKLPESMSRYQVEANAGDKFREPVSSKEKKEKSEKEKRASEASSTNGTSESSTSSRRPEYLLIQSSPLLRHPRVDILA